AAPRATSPSASACTEPPRPAAHRAAAMPGPAPPDHGSRWNPDRHALASPGFCVSPPGFSTPAGGQTSRRFPMSLKTRLTDDMKAAMKAGDKASLGVIRLINAAIKQREVDERIELDDVQVVAVLDRM